jgi:integrase/recombinase XerD
MESQQPTKLSKNVTEARAAAQRAKLDAQVESRRLAAERSLPTSKKKGKRVQQDLLARRCARMTIGNSVEDYLLDHEGGNHSLKTLQWHRTSLGLLRNFLEQERAITLVGEVDAQDINAWFAHMRKTPGGYGMPRSERTIQTYARSACAFFTG